MAGLTAGGGSGTFADSTADSNARQELIARAFIEQGYNTNYAAGWHFVRSVPLYNFDASTTPVSITAGGDPTKSGLKGLSTTQGPLKTRVLENSPVVTSAVALLGDSAPGDIDEAILAYDVAYGPGQIGLDGTNALNPRLPMAAPPTRSSWRPVNCWQKHLTTVLPITTVHPRR